MATIDCHCVILTFVSDVFSTGERLTDMEVENILKYTGTEEDLDGNVKYEGEFQVAMEIVWLLWRYRYSSFDFKSCMEIVFFL